MDEELAECLLMWSQTFKVEGDKDSVQALSDGVALSRMLNEISPSFFPEDWLADLKTMQASNKHLKMSNLKKILKGVISFYDEELGLRIQESKKPNLKLIVESESLLEMGRLLQLVLGCAVNCDSKQDYIQTIMGMEESVQHGVMTAIQELMQQDTVQPAVNQSDVDIQLQNTIKELTELKQANLELQQRCKDLDLQVVNLQEEKLHLESASSEKAYQPEDLEDHDSATGKKYLAQQQQLEQYKDEVYRLDAAKEDYRMKYEFFAKELQELKEKNEMLSALAEQARTLKDEVDILSQNEEKVKIYESTIESYKRKLEEMTDLKRTVRLLEEKNTAFLEKSVEWEEESKRSSALKSQIEVYKRQVQELQSKVASETKRADKAEFESKRNQERIVAMQTEKERIAMELDRLRETNEELQFAKLQGMSSDSGPVMHNSRAPATGSSIFSELSEANLNASVQGSSDDNIELMALPPALKEKFIRLQTENRMLNQRLAAGDNTGLQSLLEDSQSRVSELESEARITNKRMLELEAQVEDLQLSSMRGAGDADAAKDLKRKVAELTQKTKLLEVELAKKMQYIETADSRIGDLSNSIKEKDEKLQQRENELKEQEEKYKKYLEKAKEVISKMGTSQNSDPNSSPQLEILRNQVTEKERQVAQIQKEAEIQRSLREQEEKLMVSAWYNMGMQLHRKAVEDRLSQYSSGQSFLARQRQVHSRRTSQINSTSNR